MSYWILALVACMVLILGVRWSARRYEAEQLRRGRWDEIGPLVESEAPPTGSRSARMSWHLEAIGLWRTRIIRRRRPHQK